ncbi:uncharacterized protein C8A04DRAFT_37618 [Dichotomopilus funicola]|uniref:RNB domain-containing protein n=1 Tax=Dichotomopilus funicola TaxID=1934379 RepID=A0AAN6ZN63_9PEZI|nr:hypothetical protein C8A04DRAFT_37618 [Dichotomopilus funicola]
MMRRGNQNYVCWRCLSLRPAGRVVPPRRASGPVVAATPLSSFSALAAAASRPSSALFPSLTRHDRRPLLRYLSTEPPAAANTGQGETGEGETASLFDRALDEELDSDPFARPGDIRAQLRAWEARNPDKTLTVPPDAPVGNSVSNSLTKNLWDLNMLLDKPTVQDDDSSQPHFDGVDVIDSSHAGAALQAGDLVEFSANSSTSLFIAVCLGNFNGHLHFYTSKGQWFTTRSLRTGFVVKNYFEDPGELDDLVQAIPSLSSSESVLKDLQERNAGPSREIGASLIRKMHAFLTESRLLHQAYVERLSKAHLSFGKEEKVLSLREIADVLLPVQLKRGKSYFPPEALYAVYCTIMADDLNFLPLTRGARERESYMFVLQPASVLENVARVEDLVRGVSELDAARGRAGKKFITATDSFLEFQSQARSLIDQTRKTRDWSPHGMVGPFKNPGSGPVAPPQPVAWSETGLAVIQFLETWAAQGSFRPSSRYHWVGAAILRGLDRYPGAILDSSTGWTFLQEIGWIAPWDVSARHTLRLPSQRTTRHTALPNPPSLDATKVGLAGDRLARLRQEFAQSTVYCIDSADTLDVDDGISLEAAGDGEYWIHIHVADPASRIRHTSPLAKEGASKMGTSYLAGFYDRMLDRDDVRDIFSLRPDSPSLTFSARVNEKGQLLGSKVTPGILKDVVYMTPEDVSSVVGDTPEVVPPPDVLEVGKRPAEHAPPVRKMDTPETLSKAHKRDLKTLFKLATAIRNVRLEKGATPVFPSRPRARVSLDGLSPVAAENGSAFYHGDPYIRVEYDNQGSSLVSSIMQLAGEVAARWCFDRRIPIPYRVQKIASEHLAALQAFNRDVLHPKLLAGERPTQEEYNVLRVLGGSYEVSTLPGPYLGMGLDMYAKVTSPLRRYPDLVAHWQIEAALLEEHRLGTSLAGRKLSADGPMAVPGKPPPTQGFLPFTKTDLDNDILPQVRIRERHRKLVDNVEGNTQWILQALVRAWRFGEGSPKLPETFRFTVADTAPGRGLIGRLDWFGQAAEVDLEGLKPVTRLAEVKPNDEFEVELLDVNVHTQKVSVKLLKRL